MRVKSFRSQLSVFLVVTMFVLASCGGSSNEDSNTEGGGQAPVSLDVVTVFAEDDPHHDGFWMFVENLEEAAPWIELNYRGGPEVFASDQIAEAVETGAVDMATLPPGYYIPQAPFVHGMVLSPYTPMEERERGIMDLYDQWHRDEINAVYLGHALSSLQFNFYSNERIDSLDDFKGLRFRTSPVYVAGLKALGASPVDMPAGELYSALERGVVDGYGFGPIGVVGTGLAEQTKYELLPSFYQLLFGVIINQDAWNGLSDETREVMEEVMAETEEEAVGHYQELAESERAEREELGVELLELSSEEADQFLEIMQEEYRKEVLELDPERGQELLDAFEE